MNGLELYVLGYFENGELTRFVRKGKSRSVVGYDNLPGAKRGLSQSKANGNTSDLRILKASDLTEVSL